MLPMKQHVPLYRGDNGIHKFWESIDREVIIFQNHSEPHWNILIRERRGGAAESLRKARKIAEKQLSKSLCFDTSFIWVKSKLKSHKKMILIAS